MKTLRTSAKGSAASAAKQAATEPHEPEPAAVEDVPAPDGTLPPLKRQSVIVVDRLAMETAVQRSLSLLRLFASLGCALTERNGQPHCGLETCGFQLWGWDLRKALATDWSAAHQAKFNGGDKIMTSRRLGVTVEKVCVVLVMLAHELSTGGYFEQYERADFSGDLPEAETSPYLSLAADCAEYLKASFYADFGRALPLAFAGSLRAAWVLYQLTHRQGRRLAVRPRTGFQANPPTAQTRQRPDGSRAARGIKVV